MKFLVVALFTASAFAQTQTTFFVEYAATLSSSTEAVTVHLPSNQSGKWVVLDVAAVYSSAACTFRTERDGSAPTTTEITPVKANSFDPALSVTAYRTSNVGTANRVMPSFVVAAGSTATIDLSRQELRPGENLTVRNPSACSADIRIVIQGQQFSR
jgi:hypothetical protein